MLRARDQSLSQFPCGLNLVHAVRSGDQLLELVNRYLGHSFIDGSRRFCDFVSALGKCEVRECNHSDANPADQRS